MSSTSAKAKERRAKEAAVSLAKVVGIPTDWDVRLTPDCKVYFVDHSTQTTQWRHPVDKVRRSISRDLPAGWDKDRDADGVRIYKHRSGKKMYMDPRIVVLFDETRVRSPPKATPTAGARRTRSSFGRRRRRRSSPRNLPNGHIESHHSASGDGADPVPGDATAAVVETDVETDLDESSMESEEVPMCGNSVEGDKSAALPAAVSSTGSSSAAPSTPAHPYDRYSTGMQVAEVTCPDQHGKCAVITGANSGIGFETARCLALKGIHVVMACRSVASASDAADRIRYLKDGCRIDVMELDLSSMQSVGQFAKNFKQLGWPLHMLICCASVMGVPYSESCDGVELHFAINHLGHFYLTKLLTSVLRRSSPARVVVLTSELHRISSLSNAGIDFDRDIPMPKSSYWPLLAYNQSKLCNLLFVKDLQHRLHPHNVHCFAVHPGMTQTALTRHSWYIRAAYSLMWPFTKSLEQAAATVVYCATFPNINNDAFYFADCKEAVPAAEAEDAQLAQRLWKLSEILCDTVGSADFTKPWQR